MANSTLGKVLEGVSEFDKQSYYVHLRENDWGMYAVIYYSLRYVQFQWDEK